jgi:hypothetical protein
LSSWRTSSLKTHGKAPPTPLYLRACVWSAAFRALRPAGGAGLASTTEIAPASPRPVLTGYLRRDVPGQLCWRGEGGRKVVWQSGRSVGPLAVRNLAAWARVPQMPRTPLPHTPARLHAKLSLQATSSKY